VELRVTRLWASRLDDDAAKDARRARSHQHVAQVQARFLTVDVGSLTSDEALEALIAVQEHRARLDAQGGSRTQVEIGVLVDAATLASPALRAWLETRDQRSTQPGCTRPAHRCDVDHAVDFADGGPTTIGNNRLLCRRHHNAKTHLGWTVENQAADGSYDLISPAGRRCRHEPVRLLPEPPPSAAPEPPPDDDEPSF
jgi:hypothetical protein